MILLVCGGRAFDNASLMNKILTDLCPQKIRHGGAKGADALAEAWAKARGIPTEVFLADWENHPGIAGKLRNINMIRKGGIDLVVAFPGGGGTEHMMQLTREMHIPLLDVQLIAGPGRRQPDPLVF